MNGHQHSEVRPLVDHLFRHESGKMAAVLTRMLGVRNMEIADDIVQETLMTALGTWKFGKIPDNPTAWLYHVARNKAIDYLRKQKSLRQRESNYLVELEYQSSLQNSADIFQQEEILDSQLRMIFVCCHPGIPEESQTAFALKTLCGLSVREIAAAFLTTEETIAKRIYRAKEKIRNEKLELEMPAPSDITSRLESVLHVIYLLFNEGYNSSGDQLIREDVCEEAIRLCYLLTQFSTTNRSSTNALLSLLCIQASRLRSRLDHDGNIITLKFQDRAKWNKELIRKGLDYLDRAAESGQPSVYHLEAAIAALHASAPTFESTDWKAVYNLYEILYQQRPTPIVAMNKAIASIYAISNDFAWNALKEIRGLEDHYLYHATLGEVSLRREHKTEALTHFRKALDLTKSVTEKKFLTEKIAETGA
jgi:RNA polymerase sigma factor (sigma-70 family)